MSVTTLTGLLLIAVPLAFNAAFALLGVRFDYPDILRRPTSEVLARFREGGSGLILLWWAFALTAVLLAPLAVLLSHSISDADATLLAVASTVGVLAAAVQFLGLVRWPFLVPYLARADADPDASAARREAIDIVFQSFNRYLGVAVGEHLGYLFTGLWTLLAGVALVQTNAVPGGDRRRRHHRGRGALRLLARVRRSCRRARLEARRAPHADHLRRLVALAHRDGRRADRLTPALPRR